MEKEYEKQLKEIKDKGSVGIVLHNKYIFGIKYIDEELIIGKVYNYEKFKEGEKVPYTKEIRLRIDEKAFTEGYDKIVNKFIEKYIVPLEQKVLW